MGISGVILFRDEEKTIKDAVGCILPFVDELVLCNDNSQDRSLQVILENFGNQQGKIKNVQMPKQLSDIWGFGDKKNFALSFVTNKWTFVLDADEIVEEKFLNEIRSLIETPEIEAYGLPRTNIIDGEFVEHAYPDYQVRLFRTYCRYILPVHEEIVGYQHERKVFLSGDGYHIIHDKTSERQMTQNRRYCKIEKQYEYLMKDY